MRKKSIAAMLGLVLALGSVGTVTARAAEYETETETENISETETPTEASGINPLIPEVDIERAEVPDTEACAFTASLMPGWNLGNTLDATMSQRPLVEGKTEVAWQPDYTTAELIGAVHDAGFKTLRIPISWHNHLGPNYTIAEAWLDRVQEIVDYGIDAGMHVIINIHHDNDESSYCFYPNDKNEEHSIHFIERIWEQVSERFADYDEHLIFESMNEPRLVGHTCEWWLNTNDKDVRRAVEIINELNQTFVDTVRAGGGYNETRYLMVPGYDASADGVLYDGFVVPEDPAGNDHRVMVSVHAYTPYNFALNIQGTSKFSADSAADRKDIDDFMDRLYDKFVANEIPVVLGEFGALDKNGNLADRVQFSAYYTAYAASRGLPCMWWDNNAFTGNGENFGLFKRSTCEIVFPDIIEAIMQYAHTITEE